MKKMNNDHQVGKTLTPSTTTSTTIAPSPPPTTSTVTTPIIKRFDTKSILHSDEGHERKMKVERGEMRGSSIELG